MTAVRYASLIFCVLGIAGAQVFLKMCGSQVKENGLLSLLYFGPFYVSATMYAFLTILWIWAIQDIPLSRAYPLMAITFIAVPILSRIFFGDSLSPTYWVGTALIVAGTLVVVRA